MSPRCHGWLVRLLLRMLIVSLLGGGFVSWGNTAERQARPPAEVAAIIDQELNRRLTEAGIPVSPQADDAEFLRRVTLDITGRIRPSQSQNCLDKMVRP
ncbi:MAG: DUF1549 domain-containing protein [Gemmataceae bacterium]